MPGFPDSKDEAVCGFTHIEGQFNGASEVASLSFSNNACAQFDCGCADGACSGGLCTGGACTAPESQNCGAFGCGCTMGRCLGRNCR